MAPPSLSSNLKRTCDNLREGATKQVVDYEKRFSIIDELYDDLLESLIISEFDKTAAWQTAREFFGEETVQFAAIDGTLYSRPLFDLIIFFGGAYAATGSIKFSEKSAPKISYDSKNLQRNMCISSVVPIYVNEVPDVDHSFSVPEQPNENSPSKSLTDGEIANNSLIANAIMTFSEFYLALKIAVDPAKNPKVILMDRSLATERASLLYETRKTSFWHAKSNLIGYKTKDSDVAVDDVDLVLGRQRVFNKALGLPPARSDYLRTAIVILLEEEGNLKLEQILSKLKADDEKRKRRIEGALNILAKRKIITSKEGWYTLTPQYTSSWERLKQATVALGDIMFFSKTPASQTSTAMKLVKNGKEYWLTTLDISFLTLFTLQMLVEECWRKKILLVGITKDTAARDFKRQLVPIMINEGLLKTNVKIEALQALPNTDRMILQSASIFNADKILPPWSLIEYDSAFRTIMSDEQRRKGYVSGLIRNKISLEKIFLKTYVQLSQAKSDPLLRSNVLLIDRLVYPESDYKPQSISQFKNELGDGTQEEVETILFQTKTVPNRMQNLVMTMLIAMAPANIPEAFGHNKPLFIADKIAKWNYSQFKCIVDTTAKWILNNHKLRNFIFYMSTFRERRASIEQARRENP